MSAPPNTVELGAFYQDRILDALIAGIIDMTVQEAAERVPPFVLSASR
jgi:hypothetical protein